MPFSDYTAVQTKVSTDPASYSYKVVGWNGVTSFILQRTDNFAIRFAAASPDGSFILGSEDYLPGTADNPTVFIGFATPTLLVAGFYDQAQLGWYNIVYRVNGTDLVELYRSEFPEAAAEASKFYVQFVAERSPDPTLTAYTTDLNPEPTAEDSSGNPITPPIVTRLWSTTISQSTGYLSGWARIGDDTAPISDAESTTVGGNPGLPAVQVTSDVLLNPIWNDLAGSSWLVDATPDGSVLPFYNLYLHLDTGDPALSAPYTAMAGVTSQYPQQVNSGKVILVERGDNNALPTVIARYDLSSWTPGAAGTVTPDQTYRVTDGYQVVDAAEILPDVTVAVVTNTGGTQELHFDLFGDDFREIPPGLFDMVFPTKDGFGWVDTSRGVIGRYVRNLAAESLVVPASGDAVARYTVTGSDDPSGYLVTPLGPVSGSDGAFKIDRAQGTVSARFSVTSIQPFWIRPQGRFRALSEVGFSDVEIMPVGGPVHLPGNGEWVVVNVYATAPERATHWLLDLALFADGPVLDPLKAPDVGSALYVDQVYVSENGLSLAGLPYIDGSQPGAYWEGTPNDSTSKLGTPPAVAVDTDPPPAGVPGTGFSQVDATEGLVPPPLPAPPIIPPPPPMLEYYRPTPEKQAEALLTRRYEGAFALNEDVQLGELVFNTIDENGVLWLISDIDGWWTLPDPDIPDYTRGFDDGSFDTSGRYNARVFTITGSFVPRSSGQVASARAKLINAVNLCHKGAWFSARENGYTRASLVRLSGAPQISTSTVAGRTDFSIGLKAADPVKYALNGGSLPGWYRASTTGAGILTVTNEGNFNVAPQITLNGPTYGKVKITNSTTGCSITVMRPIYASEKLVIDCKERSVTVNGERNKRYYLSYDTDWVFLQPGANTISVRDVSGKASASGGTLTVKWRHGWIG